MIRRSSEMACVSSFPSAMHGVLCECVRFILLSVMFCFLDCDVKPGISFLLYIRAIRSYSLRLFVIHQPTDHSMLDVSYRCVYAGSSCAVCLVDVESSSKWYSLFGVGNGGVRCWFAAESPSTLKDILFILFILLSCR